MGMNPEFMVRRLTKYEFELHVEVSQNHRAHPQDVCADDSSRLDLSDDPERR